MSGWVAPGAAAAFWAGLLLWTSIRTSVSPWMALAVGAAGLVGAWLATPPPVPSGVHGPLERMGLVDPEPAAAAAVAAPSVDPRRAAWPAVALAVVGLVALGAGWGGVRDARIDASLLARLPPGRVTVTGTLRSDPGMSSFGWSAMVDAVEVRWTGGAASIHEPVWVNGDGIHLPPSGATCYGSRAGSASPTIRGSPSRSAGEGSRSRCRRRMWPEWVPRRARSSA